MLDKVIFDRLKLDISNLAKGLQALCRQAADNVSKSQKEFGHGSAQSRESVAVYNYLEEASSYAKKALSSMELASQWDYKMSLHASAAKSDIIGEEEIEEIRRKISQVWSRRSEEGMD